MEKERVLITVKTYPTLSRKYGETVCTAGVREDGSWVRIYPVPFRRLEEKEQYSKFDWLECRLVRNPSDRRPETFRPVDEHELHPVGSVDRSDGWRERRRILLKTARVYERLEDLIAGAKANQLSLAVFKPGRVIDFVSEPDERDWDPDKVREMREASKQYDLFSDNTWRETFRVIPKLPYKFSYKFEDAAGQESRMRVLDWEVGALYWSCLRSADGDEPTALAKVCQKYFDDFIRKDLHFFLGTTQQWHQVAPNPWVIIGVFPIPSEMQLGMFGWGSLPPAHSDAVSPGGVRHRGLRVSRRQLQRTAHGSRSLRRVGATWGILDGRERWEAGQERSKTAILDRIARQLARLPDNQRWRWSPPITAAVQGRQ